MDTDAVLTTPSYAPSSADVEDYERLRAASQSLGGKLVRTIPKRATHAIGESLGILHKGVLRFPSEESSFVFMDACLYDWIEDGTNLVQKFADGVKRGAVAPPPPIEELLLHAMLKARYTLLKVVDRVEGAGVWMLDGRTHEHLFLMDLHLSRLARAGLWLASRIVPVNDYWMTTGAGVPYGPVADDVMEALLRGTFGNIGAGLTEPEVALTFAAEAFRALEDEDGPGEVDTGASSLQAGPHLPAKPPGRNEPCPCGSGNKYKRCCRP